MSRHSVALKTKAEMISYLKECSLKDIVFVDPRKIIELEETGTPLLTPIESIGRLPIVFVQHDMIYAFIKQEGAFTGKPAGRPTRHQLLRVLLEKTLMKSFLCHGYGAARDVSAV